MPDFRSNALTLAAENLKTGKRDPRIAWRIIARPEQLQPEGDWRTWYLQGGRGSGKTRTGAQTLADWVLSDPTPGEWGIIGPTYRDAWTVMVEGESGILAALGTSMAEIKDNRSKFVKHAWRSHGEVILHSGHVIRVDSANDGALRVQGHNLKGAWCGEIGLWHNWQTAWDESIQYAVRQGGSRIVADGTPKISRPAAALIRRLLKQDPGTIVTRLRTVDNLSNLSPQFYEAVVARSKGTRLEKQELEGLLLDDVEGALWTRELLAAITVGELPESTPGVAGRLTQAYVGVDPSDGTETSDEQAYTVAGKGHDGKLYVVESFGERLAPVPFLKKVIQAALRWDARIVLEKNHGGAYLVETLKQVMKDMGVRVPYQVVSASQGKRTRAEPVSGLYYRGVVRHVHWKSTDSDGNLTWDEALSEVEDQMATYTGAVDERSPDRLDSLVWAITPFLPQSFDTAPVNAGPRRYGVLQALDDAEAAMRNLGARSRRGDRIRPYEGDMPEGDGIPDDGLLQRMGVRPGQGPRKNVRSYT